MPLGETYQARSPYHAALRAARRGYTDIWLYNPDKNAYYSYEGTREVGPSTAFTIAKGISVPYQARIKSRGRFVPAALVPSATAPEPWAT
jgi:hypothetical protein